ncbi:MAG: cystathionine beta-lyase, partial [Bacteroidetes bacterium 4572_117]
IKIKMQVPESTYLLWLDFNGYGLQKEELNKLLVHKAKIGLSPGELFGPGGEGFQRMNIACSRSILIKALDQLGEALAGL